MSFLRNARARNTHVEATLNRPRPAQAILTDVESAWNSPLAFAKGIGRDTPRAAFFFAKLLCFQCGSSPLWLLRAWPLLSRGFKTWTVQPPELPGLLYGWACPKVMMAFTIFCTFWVFAPLLSVLCGLYFVLVNFAFRYLLLFVHMPPYESGGRFYYEMVSRVLFGVLFSNVILFCWLLSHSLAGHALLVAPLPFVVYGFRSFADLAYGAPSRRVSLDVAVRSERANADEPPALRFDATLYRQPALRSLDETLDPDEELSSLLLGMTPNKKRAAAPGTRGDDAGRAPTTLEKAARRAAKLKGKTVLSHLQRPDLATDPFEASRVDRRRISDRLDAAYRGEIDFYDDPVVVRRRSVSRDDAAADAAADDDDPRRRRSHSHAV